MRVPVAPMATANEPPGVPATAANGLGVTVRVLEAGLPGDGLQLAQQAGEVGVGGYGQVDG